MKNVYVAFLSFFLFFQTILPESFREYFEQQLFIRQTGVIEDQKEYNIIIKPFIDEALNTLEIASICRECFEQEFQTDIIGGQKEYDINELGITSKYKHNCYAYVIAVTDYNVAFFNKKYCGFKKQFNEEEHQLLNSILAFNLRDPVLEYAKTKDLLEKANDAYYKKLPLSKRLLICIMKNILAPF